MNFKLISFLIPIIFTSCYYDKFDAIHPLDGYKNPCDSTLNNSYNNTVKYIMANNCTSCHNSSYAQGGIQLDTYASVVTYAQNGRLMGSILQKPGFQSMPPGTQIPSCQINKLQEWINANEPQ